MLILTAFHLFVPLRNRPHHLIKPPRDSRCCSSPCGPHSGAPRCPYLTVPGHPGGEAGGPLRLGPGLRAASSSGNPKSAGCAPRSHPTGAPFWRRRAPTQSPAPPTRHFQGRWDRCCARVPSRSPAPRRAQQAAGTAPRNAGLGGWPRRRVTETGRDGQAPPEQGTGVHRGAERDAWSPGRSQQPGRPPALAAPAASELRVSLAARLGCPGPRPPAPAWARSASQKATYRPGARRPGPGKPGEEEERRGEGDTAFAGARDFRKPSQSPSRRRPAGRGHSGRRGRTGRVAGGRGGPRAPGSGSYLGEKSGAAGVGLTAATGPFLPALRLPRSPSPWARAARGARGAGPPPAHASALPPRGPAPFTAPRRAGEAAEPGEGARSSRPHVQRPPTPPRTQPSVPRRGAASPGRETATGTALRGPGEGGGRRKVCGPGRSRPFLAREGYRREGTRSAPLLLAQRPSPPPGPRSPGRSLPRSVGLGWPGVAVWPQHHLPNSERRRAGTHRGGVSSGGGFVTPSFPSALLSRTHLPTHS